MVAHYKHRRAYTPKYNRTVERAFRRVSPRVTPPARRLPRPRAGPAPVGGHRLARKRPGSTEAKAAVAAPPVSAGTTAVTSTVEESLPETSAETAASASTVGTGRRSPDESLRYGTVEETEEVLDEGRDEQRRAA